MSYFVLQNNIMMKKLSGDRAQNNIMMKKLSGTFTCDSNSCKIQVIDFMGFITSYNPFLPNCKIM